ncbi:Spo0E family sporulation regulatory protein-aspartic acid phosphatase [Halobacillus locisalis]|uniref:Spo0E family sporulation regulatory protein-aspartic acid phosphatase n=1 Tax=Halobacillus locisalis TaxID=220753 RepID=A0A838CNN5_9BACI|nr:Spo0E family sporulation regulatory protein-aspartic acid phosphatase [Halobacillus locisalis]MBA2173667.1 Spo0E family sporulation regulatory protein-aspartic acid phosphatase [Halobacillus locisalis]
MYEAYNQSLHYERVLKISEHLDELLNKLEELKNRHDDPV